MPKPGDRVVIEGTKVGGGRREGTLVEMSGPLMHVRWEDGAESYIAPGAGSVRFLAAKSSATKAATKSVAKPAAKAKAKKKR